MPFYYSTVNAALGDHAGNWFIGGQVHDPQTVFIFPPTVVKLSQNGERLWVYPQYGFEWEMGVTNKISLSSDGNILAAGWCMMGCDFGPSGIFLHKVDNTSGEAIWENIFFDWDWAGEVYDIMETENGDIVVLCHQRFYKASALGDSLLTADFDLGTSNHFTSGWAGENYLLLGHQSGILKTDFEGNIISDYYFDGSVRKIKGLNHEYAIVVGKKVIRTDSEMNILESYDFSGFIEDDFQVTAKADRFIITGNHYILQIDFTPALVADHEFETPGNFEIADITAHDDVIFTAGKTSGAMQNNAMTCRTYTLEGNTIDYFLDIALNNLRVDNIEAIELPYQQDLYDIYWDAWVTIQNAGSDTLYRCDITSWMVTQRICDHWVYHFPVEGLYLLPGDSAEVFLGQMKDYTFYLPGADSLTYPLKIFSMQPNDKIDRNPANDMAEITFTVDLSVVINEINETKIRVYPNPASDFIIIENPENKTLAWEIFSLQNKSIINGKVGNDNARIDISNLKPGLYMVKVNFSNVPGYIEKLIVW